MRQNFARVVNDGNLAARANSRINADNAQLTRRRRSRFGAARILHELREKGVSEAAVGVAQPGLRDSEAEAARAVWQKKFGNAPASLQEKAKQARFLAGRGFSPEAVHAVLKSLREK